MRKYLLSIICVACSLGYESIASEPIVEAENPTPNCENIVFADPTVKKVCVSMFDTNGDEELSYQEAAEVRSIPSKFFGDYAKDVVSFNELKYFTNLQLIKDSAFEGSDLSQITIPDGVTYIGERAFQNTNIVSINIPDSVTIIGREAFFSCNLLESIVLSSNITSIQTFTFGYSGLQHITIPEGVTYINVGAFQNCERLSVVTIPSSVTTIDSHAFRCCSGLKRIYCKAIIPPIINKNSIYNDDGIVLLYKRHKILDLYVPSESIGEYENNKHWRYLSKKIDSITENAE